MLNVEPYALGLGREIYNDGVARAADMGSDHFVLECAGRSVKCEALELVDAATALIRQAGGKLSVLEAVRTTLEDIEERLPAEADGRE